MQNSSLRIVPVIEVLGVQPKRLSPPEMADINNLLHQLSPGKVWALKWGDIKEVIHTGILFLARHPDDRKRVIGMATLVIARKPTGKFGLIEDVAVEEAFRNQGIGRTLMHHAIETAKMLKLQYIDLFSRPSRESGNHLYEALGFQRRDDESNFYRLKC